MNRQKCDSLVKKLMAHLESFAKENNVTVEQSGWAKFNDTDLKIKLRIADEGADSEQVKAFKNLGKYYGVDEKYLGQKFTIPQGKTYILTGLNPNGKKYVFIGMNQLTSREYKFTARAVREAFGIKEQAYL